MEHVSKGLEEYFQSEENKMINLFPGLPFQKVMAVLSDNNKVIVWDYLHMLFALSLPVIRTLKEELKELDNHDNINATLDRFHDYVANMVDWKRTLRETERQRVADLMEEQKRRNEENPPPQLDESFFENSSIAKLAKEISDEVNPEEFVDMEELKDPFQVLSAIMGNKESKVGSMLHNVVDKLKNKMESGEIDKQQLFSEANTLLHGMSSGQAVPGMPGMAEGMGGMGGIMDMAQNLASMGDLFGGTSGAGRFRPNNSHHSSSRARDMRRRMRKKMEKRRKKEQAQAAARENDQPGPADQPSTGTKKKKRRHRNKKKRSTKSKAH
jgi:hypothetical protein